MVILSPTWTIWGPSWVQVGTERRPKTSQGRPKITPRFANTAPRPGQDTPRHLNSTPRPPKAGFWMGLGRILLRFSLGFSTYFCVVLGTSLPKVAYLSRSFRSMPSQVSHALATKTEPRRAQDGAKMRILAHLRHLCANMLPRSSQLEAQIAQNGRTCNENH